MTHTQEKPFACLQCAKEFAQKCLLKRHQLIHSGEKPHICSKCDKGFSSKGNLTKHQLTHTLHKPHACPECDKQFSLKEYLKAEQLYLRSITIGRKLFGPTYSGLEYDYRGLIQVRFFSLVYIFISPPFTIQYR